jgi:hypothetical protein
MVTTVRTYRREPSELLKSRVRLPDTAVSTLFGGWGVKL